MSTTEESNPRTAGIDQLSTIEALELINSEDQLVPLAVARAIPQIARAVDAIANRLKAGGRLFYVGTGTSGRLGILDASECPPTFGVSPDLVQGVIAGGYEACYRSVEASEDDRQAGAQALISRAVSEQDVVVGIAASGRTPFTIGAVVHARAVGALTIAIACNADTGLARAVEIPIEAIVGPEVITGSTRLKSGTAQKLILNMLSTMAMVRLGYVAGNRMSNLQAKNSKLQQRAIGIVATECAIGEAEARSILENADWNVPLAIVMHKSGKSRDKSEEALRQAHSVIPRALELLKA